MPTLETMDQIDLELEAQPWAIPVIRLVVGGVAARTDLAIDQVDELQLAVEAIATSVVEAREPSEHRPVRLAIEAEPQRVALRVGPLETSERDPVADERLIRSVVVPLVDRVERGRDGSGAWITLEQRARTGR